VSQGFSLFYRHAAAMAGGAAGLIFASGALGALCAPFALVVINDASGPLAPIHTLGLAGGANMIVLALSVGLPSKDIIIETERALEVRPPLSAIIGATLLGALAWMIMTGLMARSPLLMSGCGLTFSMVGLAMSVHLVAMYLPGFTIGRFVARFGVAPTCLFGLVLMLLGSFGVFHQQSVAGFALMLALAGYGWGTSTIGATAWIYRAGRPSVLIIALHDALLFVAALFGVFVFTISA
jgi:hypothetical protein